MKKRNSISLKLPDVRPLNERMTRNKARDCRKGIKRRVLVVGQGVTGQQLKLWQNANNEVSDLEPDYIKKYKHIMR